MGKTWTAITQRGLDNKLLPLKPETIAGLIKKRAGLGGLKVGKTETERATENGDILAGHFLRGHAGSVAYTLAVQAGASWDPLLGVDRARHTLHSFQANYSRGITPRLLVQFEKHPNRKLLRFEEAARL